MHSPLIPATLIYNEDAGSSRKSSPEALVAALGEAGYDAAYLPTRNEADLNVLSGLSGVFFAAGGDGTIRGVAKRLVGRGDVALGVIPLGTSNNIGHTLGLRGTPEEMAGSYAHALRRPFDAGRILAPWGKDIFFEACGCGLFADVLAAYDPEQAKSPLRAAEAMVTTLPGYQALPLGVTLDGAAQPEQPLALLEVMNIRATGNSMNLATSADPSDGVLNVIQVNAAQRDSFLAYATALARDDFEALPSVQTSEARSIQIPYVGQAFHVDGEVRPAQPGVTGVVSIQVWAGALQLLVPAGNSFMEA